MRSQHKPGHLTMAKKEGQCQVLSSRIWMLKPIPHKVIQYRHQTAHLAVCPLSPSSESLDISISLMASFTSSFSTVSTILRRA